MANHDQLAKEAEKLRNNLKDFLDDPNSSQARQAQQHVERLISDLKQKKGGDAIDNDLKNLMNVLQQVDGEVMDFNHSDQLIGICENMRRSTGNL